jgi:hypothetical protein
MMQAYIWTITDGFKNFSKLTSNAKTQAISELDKALKTSQSGGGKPAGEIKSSTQQGLLSAISKFK